MKPTEFRDARKALGYSQLAMASQLDCSTRTIMRYEAGATAIPAVTAQLVRMLMAQGGLGAALRNMNEAIYAAARIARQENDPRAEALKSMALLSDDLIDKGTAPTEKDA